MHYLFKSWDMLKGRLKGKHIFLFLDYDGTLTPIANTPDRAIMSEEIKLLLERLSRSPFCKIAIISGRSLDDIKNRVGLKGVIYSGNHGLEIEGPKIKFIMPVKPGYEKILKQIKKELSAKIASIKGVFIEDKGFSLALHFRLASKNSITLAKAVLYETAIIDSVSNKVKIKAGKKVLEVGPILEWDKGKVVLWLLARQKFAKDTSNVLPIYIGDDFTDEDAFRALQHTGITIFVGKPKSSCANYYVKNIKEVTKLFKEILLLQEEAILCQN